MLFICGFLKGMMGVWFGQDSKCPRFTAWSSVEVFGLKAQACRYFDKSCFVFA